MRPWVVASFEHSDDWMPSTSSNRRGRCRVELVTRLDSMTVVVDQEGVVRLVPGLASGTEAEMKRLVSLSDPPAQLLARVEIYLHQVEIYLHQVVRWMDVSGSLPEGPLHVIAA